MSQSESLAEQLIGYTLKNILSLLNIISSFILVKTWANHDITLIVSTACPALVKEISQLNTLLGLDISVIYSFHCREGKFLYYHHVNRLIGKEGVAADGIHGN